MVILNLGCGTRVSNDEAIINIDWSFYLRIKNSRILSFLAPLFLSETRKARLRSLPANIVCHDLSKGIPFGNDSVDAVYHSHLLEHLQREDAISFLREAQRVLKPGGIHRIAVPDLELACKRYLEHVAKCDSGEADPREHEDYIEPIIEQCVRVEGFGTSEQRGIVRWLDKLILGDARQRGEIHQWMYDRFNLSTLLTEVGFSGPKVMDAFSSHIPKWQSYHLDTNSDGSVYKPDSMYLEAFSQ